MPSLVLAALLALKISAGAKAYELNIKSQGVPIGTNQSTIDENGSVQSHVRMALGQTRAESDISLLRNAKRALVRVTFTSPHSPAGVTNLLISSTGAARYRLKGERREFKTQIGRAPVFSLLHPEINTDVFRTVRLSKRSSFPNVFLIDTCVRFDLTINLASKVEWKGQQYRVYDLNAGIENWAFVTDRNDGIVEARLDDGNYRFLKKDFTSLIDLAKANAAAVQAKIEPAKSLYTVVTPDNVGLETHVIRDARKPKYTTLLIRTFRWLRLYEKAAKELARQGYAVVLQSCRGYGGSTGEFIPWANQIEDGKVTVDWIVRQPWSNGKVVPIGNEFDAYTALAVAASKHPAVKAVAVGAPVIDPSFDFAKREGFLPLGDVLSQTRGYLSFQNGQALQQTERETPSEACTLPLLKVDDAIYGQPLPLFDEIVSNTSTEADGTREILTQLKGCKVPVFAAYEPWSIAAETTYRLLQSLHAGGNQNLVALAASMAKLRLTEIVPSKEQAEAESVTMDTMLEWLEVALTRPEDIAEDVIRYVLEPGQMNEVVLQRGETVKGSVAKTLYLSRGHRLAEKPDPESAADSYTFDPAQVKIDAPKMGEFFGDIQGRMTAAGEDGTHLKYFAPPVKSEQFINGKMSFTLSFKTSAKDTDFFIIPLDRAPDGTIKRIGVGGKVRAGYAVSKSGPTKLVPGTTYTVKCETTLNAHLLKKGHQFGVRIGSEFFPVYARNLGTGEGWADGVAMVPQTNQILHDTVNLSSVTYYFAPPSRVERY